MFLVCCVVEVLQQQQNPTQHCFELSWVGAIFTSLFPALGYVFKIFEIFGYAEPLYLLEFSALNYSDQFYKETAWKGTTQQCFKR